MQRFPQMKPILPEATYLMWVDFSQLGMNSEELRHWLVHCAGLGFNDGPSFGTGGTGFQRVNFGTPRSFIMEAIERLDTAITELKI
ncbi:beta C-S lyase family protein [Rubeoparvulum massiliense]|uniref:hypothetical protein n=1 Tax=Rubeoparvulum massiliense TaxID=1631346 RepID=UPI00065E2D21|nr:hypothetical protein [Rubeoparvulum massiliense]